MRYRAIKWSRCSDEIWVVAEWKDSRDEALKDAYADFAPYERWFYEILDTNGERTELTGDEYDAAMQWYHDAIEARDARGVWG
jgi:hypothetical protein